MLATKEQIHSSSRPLCGLFSPAAPDESIVFKRIITGKTLKSDAFRRHIWTISSITPLWHSCVDPGICNHSKKLSGGERNTTFVYKLSAWKGRSFTTKSFIHLPHFCLDWIGAKFIEKRALGSKKLELSVRRSKNEEWLLYLYLLELIQFKCL